MTTTPDTRLPILRLGRLALLLTLGLALLAPTGAGRALALGSPTVTGWVLQQSGDSLGTVACPSATTCYAVGGGTLLKTTDGGSTRLALFAGSGHGLGGVACPSASTCYAVGGVSAGSVILKTTDGGGTWTRQVSNTGNTLNGVACRSASTCYAVGSGGTILKTTTGGQ